MAIEYADERLTEWVLEKTSMPHRVPASRSDICQNFAAWVEERGHKANAREALLKILADYRPASNGGQRGAAYKQTLPKEWEAKDIPVFKGGFNEGGLLGRPGWQLMPQRTVTVKDWLQSAAAVSAP